MWNRIVSYRQVDDTISILPYISVDIKFKNKMNPISKLGLYMIWRFDNV